MDQVYFVKFIQSICIAILLSSCSTFNKAALMQDSLKSQTSSLYTTTKNVITETKETVTNTIDEVQNTVESVQKTVDSIQETTKKIDEMKQIWQSSASSL